MVTSLALVTLPCTREPLVMVISPLSPAMEMLPVSASSSVAEVAPVTSPTVELVAFRVPFMEMLPTVESAMVASVAPVTLLLTAEPFTADRAPDSSTAVAFTVEPSTLRL